MTKLSIIIPHYNDCERLDRLIKSIPNNNSLEILVIDDNSDSTKFNPNILKKKYPNKNIKVFYNNYLNKGAGACRNIGIDHAVGKWILFADSDDYFTDNFFDVVRFYFETKYQIIFFYPTSIDSFTGKTSDRHISYVKILEKNHRDSSKGILELKYNFHVPWSKLYQRNFINNNNIRFEETIASNDVLFSTYSGFYLKNYIIDRNPIYVVTKSKGSLTQNTSNKIHTARLETTIKREIFLKSVLTKKDYKKVRASGRALLLNTIIYKMGFKELANTFDKLRKNNIVIIEPKLFNPLLLLNKIFIQVKRIIIGKKYRV